MAGGRFARRLCLCCAGCLWLTGCGWWNSLRDDEQEETGNTEFAQEVDEPAHRSSPPKPRSPEASSRERSAAEPAPRISLVNSVVQELRQTTPDGIETSRLTLELTLSFRLEETVTKARQAAQGTSHERSLRYQLRFDRVRLIQELAGEPALKYDSDETAAGIPDEVQPYQGLKGNSFEFWLDRNRQLVEVVGFESFLDRCLGHVAAQHQDQMRAALIQGSSTEALTAFVGEGIGLIPAEVAQAGDSWMRTRQAVQPVPYLATTRYRLAQMTADFVDIESTGTFGPPENQARADQAQAALPGQVGVRIRDGWLKGQLRIDRRSGLPARSRVEQSLSMTVRLADGAEFEQETITVTTLEPPATR
ncbi:MAG: hypothetical protein EXS05_23425 [Planctomycetaceae bacterium]|nr:hypothetical protein [Planctomycetaceae bacterium]